jgi:virulence factor Mce-like protein
MIDSIAVVLLRLAAWLRKHRLALAGASLVLILLGGSTYLVLGTLRIDPTKTMIRIRVPLAESGGLLPNQDVTLRGVPIGRVESVDLADGGVMAVARIDQRFKIPVDSAVAVSGLSPAGEQYLDFRPAAEGGPYLADGSSVSTDRTSTPITLADLLANADGALTQLDPAKLAAIRKEIGVSWEGPDKLANLLDGGTFLISSLDGVLPETVSLLKSTRVSLSTVVDVTPGLTATAGQLGSVFAGVRTMDGGFRRLLDVTPKSLTAVNNLFDDNSETMVQLLGNLATVAQLSYVRVPALNALFPGPEIRGSLLENMATILRDGATWIIADLYPRYNCDYAGPRGAPSAADYPEPRLHGYCADQEPSVLVRGARNAPRPAGDDTAGPPPGFDPNATTDPTPTGRWTVPTPYGGPRLPLAIPGDVPLPPDAPPQPPGWPIPGPNG